MFEKVKQLHKLKKMQSEVQKQLESILHVEEKGSISVTVRGDKKIEYFVIDGQERRDIKDLINEAFKRVEKKSEKRMKGQAMDILSALNE